MISNSFSQECEILDIIMKLCCKSKYSAFNGKLTNPKHMLGTLISTQLYDQPKLKCEDVFCS